MKYMGSKRVMLQNGLGSLLTREAKKHKRVVDLFCGASSVAWFAAQKFARPVLAIDLQQFATTLANAVIRRTSPLKSDNVESTWLEAAKRTRCRKHRWKTAQQLDSKAANTPTWCHRARELCESAAGGVIWNAYGGHYFSPSQALTIDAMLESLPENEPTRSVCLSAVIIAASKCAAAPGHTAQPFQPTRTASRFLRDAWQRDILDYARRALLALCPLHAKVKGVSRVKDAMDAALSLDEGDLVFVDPPYSGVQYSRFYHVLETIARGDCGKVFGVGRNPPPNERPTSAFSCVGKSADALSTLLERLAVRGCTVLFTFPAGSCSNGLSGRKVRSAASEWFKITDQRVTTCFSTLGGSSKSDRGARKNRNELILVLRPK